MNINDQFSILLNEGVHDKGILKAVFLTGGPGSGKDYVLKNVLNQHGLVEINSDKAHEYISDKAHNLSQPIPNEKHIQKKIKNVAELKQLLALHGRNGVIVNGSGDDHIKTKEIKKGLERLGYDTAMVHVHTDDEISKKRNIERSQRGGRSISEAMRKQKWDAVQEARRHHAQMFGDNYIEYDNSADLREAEPELIKPKQDELSLIHDHVYNFVNQPPTSERSQKWVEKQLQNTSTSVPRKGVSKLPHPDSLALQQAKESGLAYYGSGKYGKGGKVTHHTINDQLVEIPETKPTTKKLSESVDRTLDIILDDFGHPKVYVMKSIAQKDALLYEGTVCNNPSGRGYIVRIKKEEEIYDTTMVEKSFSEAREERRAAEGFITETKKESCVCEEKTKQLISFSDLKLRIKESIDKGVEVGLSMTSGGENLLRGKEKLEKKESKIQELTGDESTATTGDKVEDELKKKGIELSTFKSKRVI